MPQLKMPLEQGFGQVSQVLILLLCDTTNHSQGSCLSVSTVEGLNDWQVSDWVIWDGNCALIGEFENTVVSSNNELPVLSLLFPKFPKKILRTQEDAVHPWDKKRSGLNPGNPSNIIESFQIEQGAGVSCLEGSSHSIHGNGGRQDFERSGNKNQFPVATGLGSSCICNHWEDLSIMN